jgi:hypothetical protein
LPRVLTWLVTLLLVFAIVPTLPSDQLDERSLAAADDPTAPPNPIRLIFIHHSTGENWLADENGGLGMALRDNNYFVSDTNYDWGPDAIGSTTDFGHWWLWFRGPDSDRYVAALYAESEQHSWYSRMDLPPPGDENEIIMFKSCFPNSALQGEPQDPVPSISDNPLLGQDSYSEFHTVANAKGIYADLLEYFASRPDKLFVAITAPPQSDPTFSGNARVFNEWLMDDWLEGYPYPNVFVFDFYNVLTTNGGNPNTNDLDRETGNHHRWWSDEIQHKTDGDNDNNPNVLEYPSVYEDGSSDDHPSQAGNLKATSEFVLLLNVAYNRWKEGASPPTATQTALATTNAWTSETEAQTETAESQKEEQAPLGLPLEIVAVAVVVALALGGAFVYMRRGKAGPTGTKYCVECGKPIPLKVQYCEHCGTKNPG